MEHLAFCGYEINMDRRFLQCADSCGQGLTKKVAFATIVLRSSEILRNREIMDADGRIRR